MKTVPFTHLHVHSDASLKDGLGSVDRLVAAASSKGFKHLALTDHGSLANSVAFTIACEEYGIKPILGIEGYIQYAGQIGHITLLADGQRGFESLVELNNHAHAGGTPRRPAFTLDALSESSDGIVCLTGCVSSPMHWLELNEARKYVSQLKSIFGKRLFSEVMFVADTDTWSRPLLLAEEMGLKLVITNDAHFPYLSDADVHPVLTSAKAGMTYNSKELYLKSPEEIIARGRRFVDEEVVVDALRRAYRIGHLIQPVPLKSEPSLPHIHDAENKLKKLAFGGLKKFGLAGDKRYVERVRYELKVIGEMGYSTYFLILHDVISWARDNEVRVGPGRGSGAGALLLYLIGVTEVDPLKYNLSFERFLHHYRKGYPDVDIDFDSEGRQSVIEYAERKWGAHPIAVYSRYLHRTLVHDLSKVLHLSKEEEKEAADKGPESMAFKGLVEDSPLFGQCYNAMLGQIRHKGKHAGGVIITNQVVPVERAGDSLVAAWTDGHERQLSYAGIVKFDFLGLTALTALKRMENETGDEPPPAGEDEDTMERFRSGDLVGIFQFSGSSGIAELTKKVAPSSFEDLVAINALYRPGALDVGSADAYPGWKKKPRTLHPLIDDILSPTYGAIVYQEQVMEIFARVTGGSLAEADMARRAIIKSKVGDPEWERTIATARATFLEGAEKRGLDSTLAHEIWKELFSHVRYSFNKAHAVSYCQVAWEMAWWKCHYTPLFFATMMDLDPTDFQNYLFDAADHDLEITAPHVNYSSHRYEAEGDKIYIPFSTVKFLGDNGAEAITAERIKKKFESFKDFDDRIARRLVTARARRGLYACGGFDGLDGFPIDANIDTTQIDDLTASPHIVQQHYLGAVLPSKTVIKMISNAKKKGRVAGIVKETKRKVSKHGPYVVHYLVPDGIFWTRNMPSVDEGKVVSVKVNKRTGRALEIEEL